MHNRYPVWAPCRSVSKEYDGSPATAVPVGAQSVIPTSRLAVGSWGTYRATMGRFPWEEVATANERLAGARVWENLDAKCSNLRRQIAAAEARAPPTPSCMRADKRRLDELTAVVPRLKQFHELDTGGSQVATGQLRSNNRAESCFLMTPLCFVRFNSRLEGGYNTSGPGRRVELLLRSNLSVVPGANTAWGGTMSPPPFGIGIQAAKSVRKQCGRSSAAASASPESPLALLAAVASGRTNLATFLSFFPNAQILLPALHLCGVPSPTLYLHSWVSFRSFLHP